MHPQDEGEIPEETEAKIFETMLRIRQKDPAIYQKDVKFFDDEEEGGEEVEEGAGGAKQKKAKKEKPMYLKDMIAKHVRMVVVLGGLCKELLGE